MPVTLYWMAISHPSQAARKMLELKGVEFETVDVLPLGQRVHMRLAGFRDGTVPGLKLDGRRIQGTRRISRALDQRWPEPPLFPADPGLRDRVLEAEQWGEQTLQPVPRRLARVAVAGSKSMRRGFVERQGLPAAGLLATLIWPATRYFASSKDIDGRRGNEAAIRADLTAVPELMRRAEQLMADGTLGLDPPNAATLQILASVRLLWSFDDLRELVAGPCAAAARELFPNYPVHIPAAFPRDWLPDRATPVAAASQ